MAAQTYSSKFRLPNNYQDEVDSLDTPLLAVDMNRPATILEKWLPSPFRVMGNGVAPNVGNGMAVTAGTGLSINVGTGFAVVGQANDPQPVEVLSAASLGGLPASRDSANPIYLFVLAGDGTSGTPISAYTFQPVFRLESNSTLPGAVLLARITTSASAVLTVTDMRQFLALSTNPAQRTVSTDTTMTQADGRVVMDSAGARTITVPDAAASYNRRFVLLNVGAGVLTIQCAGTDKIINGTALANDLSSITVNRGESLELLGIKRADNTYAYQRS